MSAIIPTFTRNSVAYRSDGSQLAANQPRFEAGRDTGPVEATRNLLPLGAATCTDLAEIKADSGTTKTVDTVGQWVGGGCFKLVTTGEALGGYLNDLGYPILRSTRYSASAVVKGAGNLTITFKTYPSNVTVTTTVELTDKWQRIECPNLLTGASDTIVRFIFRYTSGTGTFWIDAAQIEQKDHCTPWTEGTRAPSSQAVMVESGTTNLFLRSQEFDTAGVWLPARASSTPNAASAPDGTTTAEKLIADTQVELAHHLYQSVSVAAGTTYTFSVFAKAGEYQYLALQFLNANGAYVGSTAYFDLGAGVASAGSCNSAGLEYVGDGWYRCWASETAIAAATGNHTIMLCQNYADVTFTGDDTSGLFIWGAQLEALAYLTSYLPTTSATVTRNHDNLSIPSSLLNTESGTVECWAQARRRDDLDYQTVFAAWPFFYVSVLVGTSQARLHIQDGGGVSRNFTSVAAVDTSLWNHFVVTWNSEQMWLYVNGALACTTGVTTFQPPPAVLQLGARSSLTYLWNGLIDDLRIYQEALTAEQVATRFTGGKI